MSALSGIRKGRRLPWLTGYDQAPLAEEVPAVALRGGSRRTERCHVRWLGAVGPERAGPPDPGAGSESRPGDCRHAAPLRKLHLPDQLPHRRQKRAGPARHQPCALRPGPASISGAVRHRLIEGRVSRCGRGFNSVNGNRTGVLSDALGW